MYSEWIDACEAANDQAGEQTMKGNDEPDEDSEEDY